MSRGISRRDALRLGIAGGLGAGGALAAERLLTEAPTERPAPPADAGIVPFRGVRQAGIATPAPAHLAFTAFDVTTPDRGALTALLSTWTDAAERLTQGRPVALPAGPEQPPADTGEATDSPPASLTLTFGIGPGLFDDRFGLAAARPPGFADLPAFPGDRLDPARSGGDLMVQACAEDAMVAFHAVRELARVGRGVVRPRWQQRGFGASAAARAEATPRNLFGQKDGTANPQPGTRTFDDAVWVGEGGPAWLRGGSFLAVRRIRMDLETWDELSLRVQEQMLGRTKAAGGPLSGGGERTSPDFGVRGPDGTPLIPADSHVRLSNPAFHRGATMLRRPYSFDDGVDPVTGARDAGLFFLAYVADLNRQFVPVQQELAERDRLNEVTTTVGSAVFAVLPGAAPGAVLGQELLA